MKLTNAMKYFIDEYVEQNMPKTYDMTHCAELEATLREELYAIENSFKAEVQECLHNFIERHPEFEKAEVEFARNTVTSSVRNTPAYQVYILALKQRSTNIELVAKRMCASVGTFKTMTELIEAMDALIEEFKE